MSELRTNRIIPRDGLPSGSSGGIIQVKSVTKTDPFDTLSTSYTDVTGLAVSITPTRADSKILVTYHTNAAMEDIAHVGALRLVRDSTPIFIGDANGSNSRNTGSLFLGTTSGMAPISSNFLDSPATTNAVTYQPAVCGNGADSGVTIYVNRQGNSTGSGTSDDVQTSSIVLMEISA